MIGQYGWRVKIRYNSSTFFRDDDHMTGDVSVYVVIRWAVEIHPRVIVIIAGFLLLTEINWNLGMDK